MRLRGLAVGYVRGNVEHAACFAIRLPVKHAAMTRKPADLAAVQRNLIDRWLAPINQFQLAMGELEPMLVEIGRHLLTSALAPQAVSLHCIIIGESERRPEFGLLANEEGWQPAVRAVTAALRRHSAKLRSLDLERAAEQFMSLVIANKIRLAALGVDLNRRAIEKHVRFAVDLFLHGATRH